VQVGSPGSRRSPGAETGSTVRGAEPTPGADSHAAKDVGWNGDSQLHRPLDSHWAGWVVKGNNDSAILTSVHFGRMADNQAVLRRRLLRHQRQNRADREVHSRQDEVDQEAHRHQVRHRRDQNLEGTCAEAEAENRQAYQRQVEGNTVDLVGPKDVVERAYPYAAGTGGQ